MRDAVAQHHPPPLPPTLTRPRIGHVHRFVGPKTRRIPRTEDGNRATGGVDTEDSIRAPRWVIDPAQREEQDHAQRNPHDVENRKGSKSARHHLQPIIIRMTRSEIQEKLVAIVRQEKEIPEEKLTADTLLADAGIDSLDSLTILFAIEEQFRISIPDDRARGMKTFGDMIDAVEALVPATS